MLRRVDKHSGIPSYIQIVSQIKAEILLGRLQEGDKLPPIRELRGIFGVNMGTLLKALNILTAEGILQAEHGIGYFVKRSQKVSPEVIQMLRDVVKSLKDAGITKDEAILILGEVWDREG